MTMSSDQAVWAFTEHEHRDLARGINRIHDVACEVRCRPTPELSVQVLGVLAWLDGTLEPHIAWEEAWLYPEIETRTATPMAVLAARFDHRRIRELAERLRADHRLLSEKGAGDVKGEVGCDLFELEALLRAHLDREERFVMPLLGEERASTSKLMTPVGSDRSTQRSPR